jgi:hypothetical protein
MFDWKGTIGRFAPTVAGLIGGPAAGVAMSGLCSILKLEPSPENAKKVAEAVAAGTLTGEQLVELRKLESDAKTQLAKMGMDYDLEKGELVFKTEQAYLADVEDARKANANNKGTFWMGVCILGVFAVLMALVLYMCYRILLGGLPMKDPSVVAVVFTLIGTIVGYAASNAQTVVNFEFGTSRGSSDRSDAMANAVQSIAKTTPAVIAGRRITNLPADL